VPKVKPGIVEPRRAVRGDISYRVLRIWWRGDMLDEGCLKSMNELEWRRKTDECPGFDHLGREKPVRVLECIMFVFYRTMLGIMAGYGQGCKEKIESVI
jgi:hypothetical protein